MATVTQLLEQKGHNVEAIAPDATVYDAIRRMSDLDIGALVVVEEGKVIGLIAQRDYARNVFLKGKPRPPRRFERPWPRMSCSSAARRLPATAWPS